MRRALVFVRVLPLIVAVAGLSACSAKATSGTPTGADHTVGAGAGTGANGSGPNVGDGGGSVTLVLAGGPDAGSYKADKTACSAGLTGAGSWGNQYSDPDLAKGFSSLQLVVPDAAGAAAGTGTFQVIVSIGHLFVDSRDYEVNTTEGHTTGSGKVTVKDSGTTGKVDIAAVTADGVSITATINCSKVVGR